MGVRTPEAVVPVPARLRPPALSSLGCATPPRPPSLRPSFPFPLRDPGERRSWPRWVDVGKEGRRPPGKPACRMSGHAPVSPPSVTCVVLASLGLRPRRTREDTHVPLDCPDPHTCGQIPVPRQPQHGAWPHSGPTKDPGTDRAGWVQGPQGAGLTWAAGYFRPPAAVAGLGAGSMLSPARPGTTRSHLGTGTARPCIPGATSPDSGRLSGRAPGRPPPSWGTLGVYSGSCAFWSHLRPARSHGGARDNRDVQPTGGHRRTGAWQGGLRRGGALDGSGWGHDMATATPGTAHSPGVPGTPTPGSRRARLCSPRPGHQAWPQREGARQRQPGPLQGRVLPRPLRGQQLQRPGFGADVQSAESTRDGHPQGPGLDGRPSHSWEGSTQLRGGGA